jgi:ABC-2 type transport system ATP-binding protein
MSVIEVKSLGKRYRGTWALRECTLAIPAGHAAALVGRNGADKTTLLNLAVGLAAPTAGAVTVLGVQPARSRAALDGIAFVAQDARCCQERAHAGTALPRGCAAPSGIARW